jgi:peptidyl-prolyl cis-trans isomerase SurA
MVGSVLGKYFGRGLLAFLFLAVGIHVAEAQSGLRIAAVVNDDVISVFDLDARIRFTIVSTGLADSLETRRRVSSQVLRNLIEDKLKIQEARRLKIVVDKKDIDDAIARIESQSKMPPGAMEKALAQDGINISTLREKIEADIAWGRIVGGRFRITIRVGEEEIDEILAQMEANKGKPELRVAEIFLPVDAESGERDVEALAYRLIQQMQTGAPFSAIARNFSQSPSAAVGGDLGWVRLGQLGDKLDAAVAQLHPGQVSPPIRTLNGYYILMLIEQRASAAPAAAETVVTLHQVVLPLPPHSTSSQATVQMANAQSLTASAGGCQDMETIGRKSGSPLSGSLGTLKLSTLPADVRGAVENLPVNKPSPPRRTENGIIVMMVCKRETAVAGAALREEIRNRLVDERLEAAARRYMRDLRRAAFIDVRI